MYYDMKRLIHPLLLSLLVLSVLATGCNTISVQSKQYLGVPSYPPTDPASVQILQTQPTIANNRLGEITLQPQGNPTKSSLEHKLRFSWAQIGANAVVIVADQTMVFGETVMGPWWGRTVSPDVGRVIIGVAVRYTQ